MKSAYRSAAKFPLMDEEQYKKQLPILRADLLDAQFSLFENGKFSLMILLNGFEGSGRIEAMRALNAWADPRHIRSESFFANTHKAPCHPRLSRYWGTLPQKGKISIFAGNWYSSLSADFMNGHISQQEVKSTLKDIKNFEHYLAQEKVVLLKLWFHLSQREQKKRFKQWEASSADRWRVNKAAWARNKNYKRYAAFSEQMLNASHTETNTWHILHGSDERTCMFHFGQLVLAALQHHLKQTPTTKKFRPEVPPMPRKNSLQKMDLSLSIAKNEYAEQLPTVQGRIGLMLRQKSFLRHHSLVLVFEGMDAAGKGGCVRRVAAAMDPRQMDIVPISAPTSEELKFPYLWRFWQKIPQEGRVTIFDRSWYGRVLVERVEGFCSPSDGERAYDEINEFEKSLTDADILLIKFWLAVSPQEQLRRFHERESTRFRRFKITPDDWRNRKKWRLYERAAAAMIDRTHTQHAPWVLVEGDDKRHARIKVLRSIHRHLKAHL